MANLETPVQAADRAVQAAAAGNSAATRAAAEADRAKAEADRAAAERAKAEASAAEVVATVAPKPTGPQICTPGDIARDPVTINRDGSRTVGAERVCRGDAWIVNTPALHEPAAPWPITAAQARTMVYLESTSEPDVHVWVPQEWTADPYNRAAWRVAPKPPVPAAAT